MVRPYRTSHSHELIRKLTMKQKRSCATSDGGFREGLNPPYGPAAENVCLPGKAGSNRRRVKTTRSTRCERAAPIQRFLGNVRDARVIEVGRSH
jgi:hypothetical protein